MKVNLRKAMNKFFSNPAFEMIYSEAMANALDANATRLRIDISLESFDRPETLSIKIQDNGNGFSEEMLRALRDRIREIEAGKVSIEESGGHIGLINTCLRLHYYSNGQVHVSIRNDGGAVITISMPCSGNPVP